MTLCVAYAHIIMLFIDETCRILTWLTCQPFSTPMWHLYYWKSYRYVSSHDQVRVWAFCWVVCLTTESRLCVSHSGSLYTNISGLLHQILPKKSHCRSSICAQKSIQSPTLMYQPTASGARSPRHNTTSHRESTCIRCFSGSTSASLLSVYGFLLELILGSEYGMVKNAWHTWLSSTRSQ